MMTYDQCFWASKVHELERGIEERGGDVAGYIERHGDGGKANYAADIAELQRRKDMLKRASDLAVECGLPASLEIGH